jgi:eukaryotic-like serine/threonine-protein kinase
MGIVYEAEDILLGRRAALKFLPDEVAHEPQALARFQREARAASSLNHPNICTIYEIGEEEKRWFIAMELLDGISLDLALANKSAPLDKLLDWGIQVSDALDAAHAKGIVHRDLKPSNIFLTKRGQLKVLDFGLAKMADPALDAADLTSPNLTASLPSPLTSPGLAIGTIAFMSPEQARGTDLDARSDLFSLGTILYQMATGRMPFAGKTSAVIFDAILNREPSAVSELNVSLPLELQRIVGKCLEKNPDLRYQHASELRVDLKRLQRDSTAAQFRGISDSSQTLAETHSAPANSTPVPADELGHSSVPPASSSKRLSLASSQIVKAASGTGFVIGSVFAIAILAAAAFGIYELLHRPARLPFQNMAMTRMTSAGDNWAAAMSPDGKYLATLRRETDGRDSLWMQHLATSSSTQIVAPGDTAILDVALSPDGDYVYFRSRPALSATNDLYRVPVLGGSLALIVHDIDSTPSFSPALGRFCFMRYNRSENKQWLISVNADGSDPKVIFSGSGSTYSKPAWSPDGKHIVAGEEKVGVVSDLVVFDAARGIASHFFTLADQVFSVQFLAWTPDGHGVIVVYRNIAIGGAQIAHISYPEASFHHVTNDLNWYGPVSLSADGKTISTVLTTVDEEVDVFAGTGHTINESKAISLGPAFWLDWVNNDQLVLSRADYSGIQLLSVGSGQRKTLLSGEVGAYDIDRCGPSAVVFTGSPTKASIITRIYALDLAGGSPRQVTSGTGDQFQRCTPDGKELIYFSFEDSSIHKISMQGGKAEILVSRDRHPDNQFSITSDGKELVVIMRAQVKEGPEINFLSIDTGQVTRRIPIAESAERSQVTSDGKNIAFLIRERGVDNLWLQPVAGGEPNRLTDFHLTRSTSQGIQSYAWSPDGKRLAIARRLSKGDVVLLQDQNK